jgi:hypothetical protein
MAEIVKIGDMRRKELARAKRPSASDEERSFLAHPAVAGSIIGLALVVLLVVGVITYRDTVGRNAVDRQRAQAAVQQAREDEQERLQPRGRSGAMPVESRDMR